MIPRGKLDIGWGDLVFALWSCVRPANLADARRHLEAAWPSSGDTLACLSARSGFDLLLQALSLAPGSEVLVSAITIRDMPDIIAHHGLIPVAVDIDPATLSVKIDQLQRSLTPATKAILVAHLFGSRMPLDDIIRFARQHALVVIEDCAQAFTGGDYLGHPESDACLFSFGPIKTSTALGGGIIRVRDRALLEKMRAIQASYLVQSRGSFMRRVGRSMGLKALSVPRVFGVFVVACKLAGKDYDTLIKGAVRGFPGPHLIHRIQRQPSYPLLALLRRRLQRFEPARIERRIALAKMAIELMPAVARPGTSAATHTYWVFPIQVQSPERLMRHLRRHGFDATRGASSMSVVDPPADRPELAPFEARQLMREVLYLPVYPGVSVSDLARLSQAAAGFAASETVDTNPSPAQAGSR